MQHGTNTDEWRALGERHPAENGLPDDHTEKTLRDESHRHRATGFWILVTATGASLSLAVISEMQAFKTPAGQLFAVLALVIISTYAGVRLTLGHLEHSQRGQRTMSRLTLANQNTILAGQAAIMDRLDGLDHAIATHLPGALSNAEYVGYAKRVEEQAYDEHHQSTTMEPPRRLRVARNARDT